MDFTNPDYLLKGSSSQIKAFRALRKLQVFECLASFNPVLAGTFPLDLTIPGSDLDILCEVYDRDGFMNSLKGCFKEQEDFSLKVKDIKGRATVISRFKYRGLPFEIFGQSVPVLEQDAYRHMVVEWHLLQHALRGQGHKILELKERGYSTEEAFAVLLDIHGNPYEALIGLGRSLGCFN